MNRLTPNFTLDELTFSDTAVRHGIDNRAPPEILPRLQLLAEGLERVRAILGNVPVNVNSGYRCEALEKIICANAYADWCYRRQHAPTDTLWAIYFEGKQHPKGEAADFTARRFGTPIEIVRKLDASGLPYDKCIQEGGWVHISFGPRMRRETLTAHFNAQGVATYTAGV